MAVNGETTLTPNGNTGVVLRNKKCSMSRIKRLRKRISHSFSRLSLSREEIIPQNECEPESLEIASVVRGNARSAKNSLSVSCDNLILTTKAVKLVDATNAEKIPDNYSYNGTGSHSLDDRNGNYVEVAQTSVRLRKKTVDPVKRCHSAATHMMTPDIRSAMQFQGDSVTDLIRNSSYDGSVTNYNTLNGNDLVDKNANKRRSNRYSFGGNNYGKVESYTKLDMLGEGSYATVFKGISNVNNKFVALKEIRLQQDEGAPFTAIREASLLKELKHANIVTLHDIIHTKETLTFVFEYLHTDLSQYLEKHPGGINPRNVKLFAFQLLRGLAYCHDRRILHRDLKPQNILLSEIGELKLADFGLARAKSVPSHTYSHEVVTLWYRPPDVLLGSTNYTTSLDIWGVGCIYVEMVMGTAAFPGVKDTNDQLDKIFKVFGTPSESSWEGVTKLPHYNADKYRKYGRQGLSSCFPKLREIMYAEDLAIQLLQMQPDRRISAKAAMKHVYFNNLPSQIYNLPDNVSVVTIPRMKPSPETHHHPIAVLKAASILRQKQN